ncbi:MAG: choice-of-anchor I family protein [Hormoscilla sp.]
MTRFFVTPDDDRVTGTPDRDQISGLEGNDHLNGAGGNDELRGNQGDDILNGGPGRDRLFGGPGRDTFIVGPGSQTLRNADIIADFRPGQDLIGLRNGREFADLEILGSDNTVLRDRVTGEFLAIIRGVSPSEITPEDFTRDRRDGRPAELRAISSIELSGAEIVAHDDSTQRLFAVTGNEFLEIIDIADPTNPIPVDSINLEPFTANSVAAKNGIVAVAVENPVAQEPGLVGFFDGEGEFFGAVTVGALPDMVTFTPDGEKVLVANEGEPNDDYTIDPEGSVSIIDLSGGVANLTQDNVTTAYFAAFNDRLPELVAEGVRIFGPGATVAEDVEPEYITVSQDSQTAWISLQENNAIARLDINAGEITEIFPLGFKDHSKQSVLNTFFFNPGSLPSLGTTDARGEIKLSGFSGLYYEGVNPDNGNLQFITHPDRGPDDGTDENGDRIFILPEFQPELVRFELDRESGVLDIVDRIGLKRQDGTPLTGLPNLPELDPDTPVDEDENLLEFDPLGIDPEGVVVAPDGTFWLVDEYRPSIYHFLPDGTLFHRYVPEGLDPAVGTPALPALYSTRQRNRGFEAVAYEEGKIYAFIQTPLNNPTSGESQTIRILEFDTETATTTGEYLYIQEDMGGGSDKIGDAVSLGNGEFLVIERDSGFGPESQKKIFHISIDDATNIQELTPDPDATFESLTPEALADQGINPVSKSVYADLTALGYSFTDKPEGLALIDENTVAVLNDNDFGETGVPIGLGLIVNQNGHNALDPSDRDGEINIQNWPVLGMYQPDAIASYEVNGKTYIVTANEGDSRDYDGFSEEERVKDLTLDPTAFPNAAELQADEAIGRLQITTTLGDRDGDGDYDEIYAYGGRSFSIFEATDTGLELVFDSGNDFEKITAEVFPDFFNSDFDDEEEVFEFESRSDSKGPEPEGVVVGEVGDRTYAFIGLERIGGIMTYDVTDPFNPSFVQYLNNNPEFLATGDIAPEGLTFISPENSPTNNPLLVVGNEDSATTTIFEVTPTFI